MEDNDEIQVPDLQASLKGDLEGVSVADTLPDVSSTSSPVAADAPGVAASAPTTPGLPSPPPAQEVSAAMPGEPTHPTPGLRDYLAQMGVPAYHYQNDQQAIEDLVTRGLRNDQIIHSLSQQLQMARSMPPAPSPAPGPAGMVPGGVTPPTASSVPPPPQVTLEDLTQDAEGKWVYRVSGLPATPQDVHGAIGYARQQQQFLRDLYTDPQKALGEKLMEPILQQAMGRFQDYFQQVQHQQAVQAEQHHTYSEIMGKYGDLFFYPDQTGHPNPNSPTPMGARFYQIFGSLPPSLSPYQRYEIAKNNLAVEAYAQEQRMLAYQQQASPMVPPAPVAPGVPSVPAQPPIPASQGEAERQRLSGAAYRNPSAASPSRGANFETFLEDPAVDLRHKLMTQLGGMGTAEPLMATS